MAHAYTTKRGKNKKAKLNKRMDHQQNQERSLKQDPLANLMYDGPKESVFKIGHIGTSSTSRIDNVVSRLQKALMDKCSNPGCKNTSAEGSLSECASCHQSRYCGRECQLAHWPDHKTRCKEIRNELRAKEIEKQEAVAAALQEMNLLAKVEASSESLTVEGSGTTSVDGTATQEGDSESEDDEDDNID